MNIATIQKYKYMNDAIPYIKRILKKSDYTEDDIRDVMKEGGEKLTEFSKFLYKELPMHLRIKIKELDFLNLMEAETANQLKKTKNKKLVFGIKKKSDKKTK